MAAFTALQHEAPAPLDWLIDGLLPQGQLVLLDGAAGVGKSILCAHLVASLPNPQKSKVLYITSDDQYDLRGRHLYSQLATQELIHEADFVEPTYEHLEHPPCIVKRFVAFLREHLQAEKHLLVIIDDLEELLEAYGTITPVQYRTLWNDLRRLAESGRCTIVVPRRQGLNETRQYGPYTRLGSEASRYALALHWHPIHPGQRVISVAKNQLGSMGAQWHLSFTDDGLIDLKQAATHEHVRPAKSPQTWQPDPQHAHEMEAVLDVIDQKMQGQPVPKQELLEHVKDAGYSERAFFRTMEHAKLPSCRSGKVWMYAPRARSAPGGAWRQCA